MRKLFEGNKVCVLKKTVRRIRQRRAFQKTPSIHMISEIMDLGFGSDLLGMEPNTESIKEKK
jgi:hypothetical protein